MSDHGPEQGADDWIEMEDDGFIGLVGPFFHRAFDGGPESWFRFLPDDRHRNRNGVVQGGMVMTFMDRALGFTARRGDLTRRQATIQLDVHFCRPAQIGRLLEVTGTIRRETRDLTFVHGEMTSQGEIVATAQGIWKLLSRNPVEPGASGG